MDTESLLAFTPVPLKTRHNGWSPDRQRQFVLALARGAGPGEAARSLGMSPRAAYGLRNRADAGDFAQAWDDALTFARQVEVTTRSPVAGVAGIATLLVPRFYRGRLVGFVQREDLSRVMATLSHLDKLADGRADTSGECA